MKKAQITLFIILGIVLLVILGLVLVVSGKIKIGSPNKEDVKSFTEDCLKIAETCMLERAGENGAYLTFSQGLNPIENAKTELEDNMEQAAEICQNSFNDFKGIKIEAEKPDIKAGFNKESTTYL
jgi:type II secretory pathway pseudopilin PulG